MGLLSQVFTAVSKQKDMIAYIKLCPFGCKNLDHALAKK